MSPADTNPKIEIKDLNFYYASFLALRNINCHFQGRTITALIGPSGCGKSTLLRTLNRIYEIYPQQKIRGQIFLDGKDILSPRQDLNELRSKVGMVFQKPNPFPMTVFENIAFGIKLHERLKKSDLEARIEWALRKAFLWEEVKDKLGKSGVSLSGGQQQRLCIARAIAIKPEVILLDEPASALDPISTSKIEELMLELKKDYTLIVVTHNLQQAVRVSDFTGFMYLGELIEFGKTNQVFHNPKDQLTRDYVSGHFG